MNLIIISGRSGSGKSAALNQLEDDGYYCIDNLPAALLPNLVRELNETGSSEYKLTAVCIDARNASKDLSNFPQLLDSLPNNVSLQVVYLDADNRTLIKRFSETRRRHPLSSTHNTLADAIETERQLLDPIAAAANVIIDTSVMNLHELRARIRQQVTNENHGNMAILVQSFGFKRGIPIDADFIYDLRILPNPYWVKELRAHSGKDQEVVDFLNKQPDVVEMYEDIIAYFERWLPDFVAQNRSYLTIGIGCTGGQHRSVYMAERIGAHLKTLFPDVLIKHRDLSTQTKLL